MYKGIIIEGINSNYKKCKIELSVDPTDYNNMTYYYNDSFSKADYNNLLNNYIKEIQPKHNKFIYIDLTFHNNEQVFYKGRYSINSFKMLPIDVMARIFELYEDKKEI